MVHVDQLHRFCRSTVMLACLIVTIGCDILGDGVSTPTPDDTPDAGSADAAFLEIKEDAVNNGGDAQLVQPDGISLSLDSGVQFELPADAVPLVADGDKVVAVILPVADGVPGDPADYEAAGDTVEVTLLSALSQDELQPTGIYRITVTFFDSVTAGDVELVEVGHNDGDAWDVVPALSVDFEAKTATAEFNTLSLFRVFLNRSNTPPIAQDQDVEGSEDEALGGTLVATDANGNLLAYRLAGDAEPTSGSVVIETNGDFVYTPEADFHGEDSFRFVANDGSVDSNVATVTISLAPVNDAPVATDDVFATDEDLAVSAPVLVNDSDVDLDALQVVYVDAATQGVAVIVANEIHYTPNLNYNGPESVTYVISDGEVTDVATAHFTVNPVNDAPVAASDVAATAEDTLVSVAVLANDTDVELDPLTIVYVADPPNGSAVINGNAVDYTPALNFSGADSITYVVEDGNGGADIGVVHLTVDPVNDAPVASNDTGSLLEDSVGNFAVLTNDSDVEGHELSIVFVGDPGSGDAEISGQLITYTPAADFAGADNVTYVVSDGVGGSDVGQLALTVTAVNDAPQPDLGLEYATLEDGAAGGTISGSDPDVGDALTFSIVTGATDGLVVLISAITGEFTYTPDQNFNGTDQFWFAVSDGIVASVAAEVALTVTAVNDAPVGVDDSRTGAEDTVISAAVLTNDTDLELDLLQLVAVGVPANGNAVINGDSIDYTPDQDFNGVDAVTYTVGDGNGGTDIATLSITVTPVNDGPTAVDDYVVIDEDTSVSVSVLTNDTDPELDPFVLQSIGAPQNGTAVVNGTAIDYYPNQDFYGADSVTYVVSDGLAVSVGTLFITVESVNDQVPIAESVAFNVTSLTLYQGQLTATDDDFVFRFEIINDANSGQTTLDENSGVFTYISSPGFSGVDSFTYRVSDGVFYSPPATVSITVIALPAGTILTIAGLGTPGYSGDGGPAASAEFNSPQLIEVDQDNNVYIADALNNIIRKVYGNSGTIETVGGSNGQGGTYSGDGGPARDAGLNAPLGLGLTNDGELLIADSLNEALRQVYGGSGTIDTIAGGNGTGYSGDGGPAGAAQFNLPVDIAVAPNGDIYIADASNNVIRKIDADTGIISTVVGTGSAGGLGGDGGPATQATINGPFGMTFDALGNLYFADNGNHAVRKLDVETGILTTVAGNGSAGGTSGDGGAATQTTLSFPSDIAIDSEGNIFIADTNNNVVRKVDSATGIISTVAGTGTAGSGGDGGQATSAQLNGPTSIAIVNGTDLLISDAGNHSIRRVFGLGAGWAKVAASSGHACGLKSTGALWCWGSGSKGEIGDGASTTRFLPVQEASMTDTWIDVSTDQQLSCGVRADGTLWCWGSNFFGQLGDGTTTDRDQPTQESSSSTNWIAVANGSHHTCALKSDGSLWCWGNGGSGQLGDGTTVNKSDPTQESSMSTDWSAIAAGGSGSCALKTNGTVWCWGINSSGQLGDGTFTNRSSPTQEATGAQNWVDISFSGNHACALKDDDTLWCWGNGGSGQVGMAVAGVTATAIQEGSFGTDWATVSANSIYTCASKHDGTLWCWGDNTFNYLADGTTEMRLLPVQEATGRTDWVEAGNGCGRTSAGTALCWSLNSNGRLGIGRTNYKTTARRESSLANDWSSFDAGSSHICALKESGQLWCWGTNFENQLGVGDIDRAHYPLQESSEASDWVTAGAGNSHTCAIKAAGTLWCWGDNIVGQLGDGTTDSKLAPTQESSGSTAWQAVQAGGNATCALRTDGTLWCWGRNSSGTIGDGTQTDREDPTQESSASTNWTSLSLDYQTPCAIKSDGTLWCWGRNVFGNIGNGTTTQQLDPTKVSGGATNWKQVDAEQNHTCAVRTDGSLWCWGSNNNGQIGDGSTTNRTTPRRESSNSNDWDAVSVGNGHSCGLKTDKSVWCWGSNNNGRLGDGTTTNRLNPTPIVSAVDDWQAISVPSTPSACALKTNGSLWCWGQTGFGILGLGFSETVPFPLEIGFEH